jgi:hypothetical protein
MRTQLDLTAFRVPPDSGDGPVGPSFDLAKNPYLGPGTNARLELSLLRTIAPRSSTVMY